MRDLLLARLADAPLALVARSARPAARPPVVRSRRPSTPAGRCRRARSSGISSPPCAPCSSNPGARRAPDPAIGGLAGGWSTCVAEAVAEVERRQRARRQIGYDRLVSDLAAALADPREGPQLAAQLAARYRLVLVDEFQDTDRLQWEIFDRAFAGHRLITVGDPKQAIFRFRGADVHAYLDAVRSAERTTLRTNHRSDRQLLDALGLLFDGARLGHADIEFARVDASPTAPHNALGEVADAPARRCPTTLLSPHTSQGMEAGAAAALVLADVASRVRAVARHRGRSERAASSRRRPAVRHRHPRPVAAPCRGDGQRAARMGHPDGPCPDRLGAAVRGRSAVAPAARRTGDADLCTAWPGPPGSRGSSTLPRPSSSRRPGGAAADGDTDTRLAQLQRRLAALAERLRRDGVGALYEEVRASQALLDAVLGRPNGDRDLTDLDHLAELLVAELGRQAGRAGRRSPRHSTG